jgi:hypothetical protein
MGEAKPTVPSSKGQAVSKEVETGLNPRRATSPSNLFGLIIDADTGEIVNIEKVEGAGVRRDLRDDDMAGLTASASPTLNALIERAFEAGIACMLGGGAGRDEAEESAEEADLRRALLMPLIEGTLAKGALKREVLGKAILVSAIAQVAAARTVAPEKREDAAKAESVSRRPN